MNSKKVNYILLGSLGILALGCIIAVYLGNSMLKNKSSKLVELKLENRVLEEQQVALVQANKDIEKYSELESIAKSIVPQDKDQAKSVREIIKIAADSGVQIASITFPTSTLGTAAPKPATNTNSSEGSTTPAPAQATPPLSQVKPVDGIKGVYQLEITIKSEPSAALYYDNLVRFLENLENNRRTAQVSQINITPSPSNIELLTFELVINVFIKP